MRRDFDRRLKKLEGASADADRAATPSGPSPAVSGIAGIPSAVRQGLSFIFGWAEGRLHGTPADRLYWLELKKIAASSVTEALHDAGYAIVPMGGELPTQVTREEDAACPYRTHVRVRLQMRPIILGAEQAIPNEMMKDGDFRHQHLPRMLARTLLGSIEGQIGERISAALSEPKSDPSR